ncbi:hypothetical protein EV361DRAFT_673553 [Lentinula raphanica]|uniref:Uncharacterized protein n=1 Tax=Lentinula raphanica TaxID=153919 RepID=A0AA38U5Q0_9AGAR|nr:hypothetical protein FB446DRAFT_790477 [Lentinula raphanica]KAJ3818430.1 hypothetical protein F5880DRAFT_1510969 [Lentinula raphanica]KAJ3832681.1 hypothetical protein F5878DRAFT_646570 [Lentinula raphanica]KAJ3965187.1 hypothetical protein EV361DRAFT_673553 [Lentinula raphanica]
MTEYDYSPEAVERYNAKLRSIGRWVQDTERHELSNPYVLSPAPRQARLPSSDTSLTRHRPHRSYTAPPKDSSSSTSPRSPTSQVKYSQQVPQIYTQPQQYTNYPQPAYPYPVSPPMPARQYPPPQRSYTYAVPQPPPPPPPRPSQFPKRSNTIGGYAPQLMYDPRVGASRAFFPMQQVQPPTPTKSWFGKLFSSLRSSSPTPMQSPISPTGSRHSRSRSAYYNDRDRDRDERSGRNGKRRSKSHTRSTKKHHRYRSSSL